jgi:hypothetical protein
VAQIMLWFSQRASWCYYTASILVQIFNQLGTASEIDSPNGGARWVQNGKGES